MLGVGFASGDLLALRRFPLTSRGPAYTSVWHRSPAGSWTLFTDVADQGCARHLGPALETIVVAPIRIEWTGPRCVEVAVDGGRRLTWTTLMRSTAACRSFNRVAPGLLPICTGHPWLLSVLTGLARMALRTGPLRLAGVMPSGVAFTGHPRALWVVRASRACIDGHDTGPDCRPEAGLALGDFPIPRRGLFTAVDAVIATRSSP